MGTNSNCIPGNSGLSKAILLSLYEKMKREQFYSIRYYKIELKLCRELLKKICALAPCGESSTFKESVEAHIRRISAELEEAVQFIENCADPYTKKIMQLRFIKNYSWRAVSASFDFMVSEDTLRQHWLRCSAKWFE